MRTHLRTLSLALACAGLVGALPAMAQTTTSPPPATTTATKSQDSQLATRYQSLAGSPENAQSLVTGLRTGTAVTLNGTSTTGTTAPPPATFTPATGKLGYGNVNIALSLAKASLAKQGITNPTPAQLAAALNGGTITTDKGTVTMAGVLSQRQSGMGWGQIANSMGVKLGSLMSASKTNKASVASNTKKSSFPSYDASKDKSNSTTDHAGGKHGDSSGNHGGGNGGGNGGGGGGGGGHK